jgi:hypothetical protein
MNWFRGPFIALLVLTSATASPALQPGLALAPRQDGNGAWLVRVNAKHGENALRHGVMGAVRRQRC